jgi:sugar-specific transcriptional regulator TrmB
MQELYESLRVLGFSQYEARAYTALLRTPRVTAYELAKRSGVPPSKIYEVVDRLLAKELVVSFEEAGSTRYGPLDPQEAMARFRRSYGETFDYVDKQLHHLYEADPERAAYVWSLGHRTDIFLKAREMIDAAGEEVYLAIWPEELPEVLEALREAEARRVAIALCLYGSEDPGVGLCFLHPTDEVVLRDQGARRLVLVADNKESLIAYFPERGEASAHWSRNIGFIQMTKDYIRHDIWIIKMVQRFEGMINDAYGPDRERLRSIFPGDRPGLTVVSEGGPDRGNGATTPEGDHDRAAAAAASSD